MSPRGYLLFQFKIPKGDGDVRDGHFCFSLDKYFLYDIIICEA